MRKSLILNIFANISLFQISLIIPLSKEKWAWPITLIDSCFNMWTVQKVSLRWRNGIQMHHLNLTAQSTLGGVGFPIFPEVSSAVLFGCNWCLYLLVCHFVTARPGLLGKGFLSADVWTILKSNVSFQNGNYLLPTLEKWTWALTFFFNSKISSFRIIDSNWNCFSYSITISHIFPGF